MKINSLHYTACMLLGLGFILVLYPGALCMGYSGKPKFHRCAWTDGEGLGAIQCKRMIPDSIELCHYHYKLLLQIKTPVQRVTSRNTIADNSSPGHHLKKGGG